MNSKTSFGKKFLAVLLSVAMIVTSMAFVTSSASAAETTDAAVTAVQPTDGTPSTFSWDNATVYFMLTDRFYNGNTSNDHSYGRATNSNGSAASGWNTAPGTFHGGDFKGVTQKINEGYFNNLGVNAIWITAPYEQAHGYCSSGDATGNFAHYAYHGYYVLDYTETDKNMGTKEEFKTMVDTAHEHGIRIVLDIVMNHAGYNTLLDMEAYNFGGLKSGYESWKYKLTNVGGFHDYVDYKSNSWSKWWGAGWIRAGLPGYTAAGGDDLTMGLSGLPDFKTESTAKVGIPEVLKTKWTKEGTYNAKVAKYGSSDTVSNYLVKWLAEWVETYGIDGFRCDTAKHVELASWAKLEAACTKALKNWKAKNPTKKLDDLDFWMTGENFGQQVDNNQYYSQGKFDSMINFAFGKRAAGNNMPSSNNINGTYANYASKINSNDNFNVLSYVSSHDDGLCRGNSIWTGSAFLLLPGAVQIFYGDETDRPLLSGNLEDHAYRSDMNWNAVSNSATLKHWQKVGQFRNNHIAVGAGQHKNLNATSGAAFARTYDKGTISDVIAAVIGANKNTDVTVTLNGTFSDGTVVTNAYDGKTATVSGGKVTFNSGANGTILIEGPQSSISVSLKGDAVFEGSQKVTLNLRGADNATVTIDNGTPFTAVDGQQFTIGENTELGGTVTVKITASNSEDRVERTFTFKKKDPNAVTKIYFDNSSYKWSAVYAYIYKGEGESAENNAAWPGVAMTKDSTTGYYVIEVPENLVDGQAMFAESATSTNRYPADMQPGMQIGGTSKLFAANHSWTDYQGPTPPTVPTPPPVTTGVRGDISGDKVVDLTDCCLAQKFIAKAVTLTEVQQKLGDVDGNGNIELEDVVSIMKYLAEFENTYKIGEVMTIEVPTVPTPPTDPEPPTPPTDPPVGDKIKVYFSSTWSNANCYYWSEENTTMTSWPGEAMTAESQNDFGETIYTLEVPSNAGYLIFNNGSDQTKDYTWSDKSLVAFYNNGGTVTPWEEQPGPTNPTDPTDPTTPTDPPVGDTVKVYFSSTWSKANCYYWSEENTTMTSWPGEAMTAESQNDFGETIYTIEVPSNAGYLIFNNGGDQTKDYTWSDKSLVAFYNNGGTVTPWEEQPTA